jgi:hypothetical protein
LRKLLLSYVESLPFSIEARGKTTVVVIAIGGAENTGIINEGSPLGRLLLLLLLMLLLLLQQLLLPLLNKNTFRRQNSGSRGERRNLLQLLLLLL